MERIDSPWYLQENPETKQSSSLLMSTTSWDQNQNTQNSRENMPTRWPNRLIPVDPNKPLPPPLTKSSSANIQKTLQQTRPAGTNIIVKGRQKRATATASYEDIQHVAALSASVRSSEYIGVNHQQFSLVPEMQQQNFTCSQELKRLLQQDSAQNLTAHRFAPQRLENDSSEVTSYQPIDRSFRNGPTIIPNQFYQPINIQHQAPIDLSSKNGPASISSQFYQSLDIYHQAQSVTTHQDAQQCLSISNRNNRRSPTLQGVQKTTPPPALPRASEPIPLEVLKYALEYYQWNEQDLTLLLNVVNKQQTASGIINNPITSAEQNHPPNVLEPTVSSYRSSKIKTPLVHAFDQNDEIPTQINCSEGTNSTKKRVRFQDEVERSTTQTAEESGWLTDVHMRKPPLSPPATASDSRVDTDHVVVSGYEESKDEAHDDASNATDKTKQNVVDSSQNSFFYQFSTICRTVSSSLSSTAKMLDNLANTSDKIAKLPKYSESHAPPSSDVIQEVSPVAKERQNSASKRGISSSRNQQSNDSNQVRASHKKDSKKRPRSDYLWFVLPEEYDPDDTRWTLKHQNGEISGLVELLPKSKIYVKSDELKCCEQKSSSCECLARLVLPEVFTEAALGVCATLRESSKAYYRSNPDARPPLDNHGSLVLINYVIQHGIENGWEQNVRRILQVLDNEIKEMRFKYGLKTFLGGT